MVKKCYFNYKYQLKFRGLNLSEAKMLNYTCHFDFERRRGNRNRFLVNFKWTFLRVSVEKSLNVFLTSTIDICVEVLTRFLSVYQRG